MNCSLSKMKDHTLLTLNGVIDGAAVISAGSFIRDLNINYPCTVILDLNGLEDNREMFYHVALINTFKKEVEQAGGVFKIRTTGRSIKKYLTLTGLKELFIFDDPAVPAGAEV